jgi:hypothetical protein
MPAAALGMILINPCLKNARFSKNFTYQYAKQTTKLATTLKGIFN